MKQGDKFIKILMILLAAVVLSYFGYAAWNYLAEPLATVTALEYEADIGASVTGYVVREETPLAFSQPITVPRSMRPARPPTQSRRPVTGPRFTQF